jgi:hypothetical protein
VRARVAGPLFALLAFALGPGCEDRRAAERRAALAEEASRRSTPTGAWPQALMIRFQATQGSGFARESWELEVLQLGGEARLNGSMRTPTRAVPVIGTLAADEWAGLWSEVAAMPLDGWRVEEDTTVAPAGWTKRLDVDIVLGPDRRIISRNSWQRPPRGAPWLDELEGRLRALAEEHAVVPEGREPPDSTSDAVDRAVRDAMGDLEASP